MDMDGILKQMEEDLRKCKINIHDLYQREMRILQLNDRRRALICKVHGAATKVTKLQKAIKDAKKRAAMSKQSRRAFSVAAHLKELDIRGIHQLRTGKINKLMEFLDVNPDAEEGLETLKM
ncbi:hypothetical protein ACHAPU_009139 [Fusarium lateritium]